MRGDADVKGSRSGERRRCAFGLALLTLTLPLAALSSEPITPDDVSGPYHWGSVKNVTQLRHLYISGQPDAAGFAAARDAGIAVVIDLRAPGERDWDEVPVVEGLGMTYHNVPVHGASFDPEAFERIEALVKDAGEKPILLHCSSSNRVAGWLAVHLALAHDMTEEEAIAVGRRAGITKSGIEERVHDYLAGERARRALAPAKQGLSAALKGAMAESPEAAVETCQLVAPSITAGAEQPGISIGRTSHRTRNPLNDPEAWMRPLLDDYLETPMERRPPRILDLGERGMGYVEPIYLKPMCATCHGAEIDADLLALIRERYPEDRAVDFMPGELRGLFWVVVAPESPAP
jgi:uncharacterized protein (TIGR01244 family)